MTWIFRACVYINLKEAVKVSGQSLLAAIGAVLVEDYPELSEGRQRNDMLIAAHALALDCIVITANVGEFTRVPGLRVENWLQRHSRRPGYRCQ